MKLLSPIDVTVLTWLKPELDSTLNQARTSLEHYAEEGQGVASLRECITHLHQVAGILNMVELAGAARLAEEMEQLAYGLAEGDVKSSDNAFTFLMQCIVQLPDYLERLQNGHRDAPAVLLPLINELRSIRGEVPISEEAVYSAATHLPIPEHAFDSSLTTNAKLVFSELALQFQAFLLAWINNQGDKQATNSLAESCAQIGAQIQDESSRKVFWVASALLDAAAKNKLVSSKAIRNSIIKIDQEVNYINNRILGEVRQSSPVRLTQELLYFVAQNPNATDRLRQVYEVFELERNIPNETEIEHAKSSLLGRNNALLQSVSAVIKEDILRVKDSLDMFIRNKDAAPKDFVELVSVLNRIENTLGLIDATGAKDLINKNKDIIQGFINGVNPLGELELMNIAKSLLSVELMLDNQGVDSAVNNQTKLANDFLSSSQSNQLLDALIRESIVNFAAARQAFVAFVESYWDHSQLAVIPSLFRQVSGALSILEFTPVSNFIDAINSYTRYEFIEQKKLPSAATMERLAEVLASLEYYLESVRDRRPNREKILEITQKSLESLNYWPVPDYAIQKPGTYEDFKVQDSVIRSPVLNNSAPVVEVVAEIVDMPYAESEHELVVSSFKPDIDIGIIHAQQESDVELQGFDINAEGIDDEIREIFLEEFAEESANLSEFYTNWQTDLENVEHVRPIRRVFHTFKGSGRLVGAKDLSDFSWKIESLLNRVLDGSRPPSNEVITMLGIAIDVLPKFNAAMLGDKVFLDLEGLSDVVDRLAAGEEAIYKLTKKRTNEIQKPVESAATSDVEQEAILHTVIDPILLEILKPEVSGHIETVNAWLDSARNSSQPIFEDTVFRAIHTMNGAFAMSEVLTMSELLAPTESLLRRAIANKAEVKSETIYFMGQVVAAVKQTLQDLSENKSPASFQELALRAVALRDELPEMPAINELPLDSAALDDSEITESDSVLAERIEAERIEAERVEAQRLEAERLEVQRLEAERIEAERVEAERVEAERVEAERVEAAQRLEAERVEAERVEAQRLEAERVEAERVEAERVEAERVEAERVEAQRLEAERIEAERIEAERIEAERIEAERIEAERVAAERVAAERVEAQRLEAERVEAERVEAERVEAERVEAERVEAQRLEAERIEAERIEAERIEAERVAAERIEAERIEAERIEAERIEAERVEAQRLEAERVAAERIEAERIEAERIEAEREKAAPAQSEIISDRAEPKRIGGKRGEAMRLEAKRLEAKRLEALRVDVDKNIEAEKTIEIAPPAVEQTLVEIKSVEPTTADVRIVDQQETPMANLDMSDLDEELLDIFAEEAKDLLDQSDNLLVNLKAEPDNFDHLHGLQRHLHTIKGGARMAGLYSIGELSHSLETVLHHNTENRIVPNIKQISIIERSLDALHKMANLVEERKSPELPQNIMQLLESSQHAEVPEDFDQIAAELRPSQSEKTGFKPLSGPIELPDLDADEAIRTPQEVVRIRADLLEQLVNFSGEVAIYRARLEQQLGLFKINLVELDQTTTRLREQLRRLDIETEAQIAARNIREVDQGRQDFDPLELDRFTNQQQLSRSLAETSNDLVNLQATMDDLTRHHETLLLQQSRVSSELQEGLMRTRMLPFETLLPRLRRVLRQASQDAGKEVQLRVEGAQGEMDRTVLDRMIAPLEHLLRNAVAHGIEDTKERKKAGKSETATIVINIAHEGTEVVLSVRDDGRGMNIKQIHAKGVERGLVAADTEMTEQQILKLITQTGFTTADTVTRLSGRGVGMDVVNNEIKSLNGTLSIQTALHKGTEFIVRLPLNLAVTKAVFVKIGESLFAIPIASVDGVGRIGREELQEKNQLESPEFNYAGNTHKIYDLGTLLEMPKAQAVGSMQMPMLLSKSGQDRIAVCVDQVLGSQEIVVKPVGPQVTSIPGVYGASIMPDGGVIVILDLAPLVRHNANRTERKEIEVIDTNKRSMPLVMVVDDSITMRKVTSRILERNNYEVITARDGLEAIEKMAEQVPDLVLLDIEMPRMDGYEVAQNMKADSRLMNVPIMMITSRTGDKHRQRAFDLGVERYLGKPYQELELMRQVNDVFKK